MIAIGNEELKDLPNAGKTAKCPNCGKKHKIKYGIDKATGLESNMLGFVDCGKESFLVAVDNKLLK